MSKADPHPSMNVWSHHENVWYGMVQSPNASGSSAWHSHAFLSWRTAIFTYTLCCWPHSEMEVCNMAITLACDVYVHSYIYTYISHTPTNMQARTRACAYTYTHTHNLMVTFTNTYHVLSSVYTLGTFLDLFALMPLANLHHFLNCALSFLV
jgi:hypothetical protein